MAAHDSAGASASTLAETGRTRQSGQAVFGPCLDVDMGEAALVAALNAWGSARDREALALRAQAGVEAAFERAQAGVSATLVGIIEAFRTEAETMRQHAAYEAHQSLARPERVVSEAGARFGEQDARFAAGLGELAQRLQAADTWAQGETARVAAMMQAAPAPPPVPSTPPAGRLVVGPTLVSSPAWRGAHAAPPPAAASNGGAARVSLSLIHI